MLKYNFKQHTPIQGGITCEAIDEPRKSSKAIDKRVIKIFATKMSYLRVFATKMGFLSYLFIYVYIFIYVLFIYMTRCMVI